MSYYLLVNPFENTQTRSLLICGVSSFIVGTLLAYFCEASFYGIFSIQFNNEDDLFIPFLTNLANIIALTIFLFIAGRLVNSRTRLIDMLNTAMLSRIPFYLLLLFNSTGNLQRITDQLIRRIGEFGADASLGLNTMDLIFLSIVSIAAIALFIWKVILLYNGYKIACNARNTKAILLFILALIFAGISVRLIHFI